VAILARNSADYLVFIVAAFRAGAILLPLNWRLSAAELQFLLADAPPALVVYDEEFAAPLQKALAEAPATAVASQAFAAAAESAAGPWAQPAAMGADAPFILLYTSGTTGKPKGAVITRQNAFFQSLNFAFVGQVTAASVIVCDAPMFHTVGLMATAWTALQQGATLAISDRFTPADTLARLSDEALGASHYFGVPQIVRALVDDPAYQPRALARLTGLFVGGSPMPFDLTERLAADGVKVANGFGMSETGTVMHVPLDLEVIAAKVGSVGLPGPATQVCIMTDDGAPAAAGAAGELWIRGPGIAASYWRRPDAVAAAFHDGWFRTGDICRQDADGFFYVLDRSKDMYISGGENVYPAEVESALLRIPGVADAAVVGVEDDRWGEVGCAYLVRRPGADALQAQQVIEACGEWLASYKRPKHVAFVEAIPRNAAGKALKGELRALFQNPLPTSANPPV
jgi:fatty-acyl-CoA synthase